MNPKEFIENVLINEVNDVVERHAYISFLLIAVGIEFLGKCLSIERNNWHDIDSKKAFEKGKKLLEQINPKYKELNLINELRHGFAHTFIPKPNLLLSERKHGAKHLYKIETGQVILVAEDFFQDFVAACRIVQQTEFDKNDKMNKPFLFVGNIEII